MLVTTDNLLSDIGILSQDTLLCGPLLGGDIMRYRPSIYLSVHTSCANH